MINWIAYKGISSFDLGLYIKSKNTYSAPERDVTFFCVPGRNGDIALDNKRYKNIDITYEVTLISERYEVTEAIYRIKSWLLTDFNYHQLIDSYDPDYFRMGSFSSALDIIDVLPQVKTMPLRFKCKPMRYSRAGQEVVTIANHGMLVNSESWASKPHIKIYGSGNVTLFINNGSYAIKDVVDYINIDTELMSTYKNTNLLNNKIHFKDFPTLEPGENNISWVGAIDKIEIIPRWCSL